MVRFVAVEVDPDGNRFAQRPGPAPVGKRWAFRHLSHDGRRAVFVLDDVPAEAQRDEGVTGNVTGGG